MRQVNCPECGQSFPISGEGKTLQSECPNCTAIVSILENSRPCGVAALLPGAQFLRGRSYGWYSALLKGRRG